MARIQYQRGTSQAVSGVEEFARALKAMSPAVRRELDKKNRVIGSTVVAKGKGAASGVGRQQAAAAESMRATSARGGIAIRLPNVQGFELGAEYGAKQYPQFPPWRGNQFTDSGSGPGYFMQPTIRQESPRIVGEYLAATQAAAAQVGLRMTPSKAGVLDIARTKTD